MSDVSFLSDGKPFTDPETLRAAYGFDLLAYDTDYNDNRGNALTAGCALLRMVQAEHQYPGDPLLIDRILAHIRNLISNGNTPFFDSEPYWNYPIVCASLYMAKATPTVWERLTQDEIERIDTVMKAFTYITSYNTADANNFRTGPRLRGNYCKNWNPNYRLANVLPIFFCSLYFGGADEIDRMLANFDEDEYERIIAAFRKFGFWRAEQGWTTPGGHLEDGTEYASGKELLLHGTKNLPAYAVTKNPMATKDAAAGEGVGVRADGAYTYFGFRADDYANILSSLLSITFGGGPVQNGYVRDGELLCYILDGTSSPVFGYPGMMKELNGGDGKGIRSNAGYCDDDFTMLAAILETLRILGLYTLEDHPKEYALTWVGMTDAVYKFIHGYKGFSLGKERIYEKPSFQASMWIPIWNLRYGDLSILNTLGIEKEKRN